MGTPLESLGFIDNLSAGQVNRHSSDRNLVDDASHDLLLPPVVKPGGPGVGMAGQMLDILQRHALGQANRVIVATRNEWGERRSGRPMPAMRCLSIRPMSSAVIAWECNFRFCVSSLRNSGLSPGADRRPAASR